MEEEGGFERSDCLEGPHHPSQETHFPHVSCAKLWIASSGCITVSESAVVMGDWICERDHLEQTLQRIEWNLNFSFGSNLKIQLAIYFLLDMKLYRLLTAFNILRKVVPFLIIGVVRA